MGAGQDVTPRSSWSGDCRDQLWAEADAGSRWHVDSGPWRLKEFSDAHGNRGGQKEKAEHYVSTKGNAGGGSEEADGDGSWAPALEVSSQHGPRSREPSQGIRGEPGLSRRKERHVSKEKMRV